MSTILVVLLTALAQVQLVRPVIHQSKAVKHLTKQSLTCYLTHKFTSQHSTL